MRKFGRVAMLGFLIGIVYPAFAAPPPVEAFFQDAQFAYASMAPDGRSVAVRVGAPGVRTGLVVYDLASMTPRVVSRNPQSDVDMVWWISEKRIAFSVVNIPPATIGSTNGLYAIDADGSDPRGLDILGYSKRSFAQTNPFGGGSTSRGNLSGISPQSDDTMFIGVSDGGGRSVQQRLNTRTAASSFVASPFGTFEWLHDEARVMRVALAQEGKLHVLYEAGGDGKWRKVTSFDPKSDAAFLPYYFAKNVLYVRARKGGDRASIYRYNLATATMEAEPIISSPEFDVEGYMLHDGKKMTGFSMQADADSTVWFDPAMKALQAEIDRMLPNTVNAISRGKRGDTPYVLVNAFAPTQPLLVLVYNRDTKKLTQLGSSMPQLSPAQLAGVDFVHYKSRDGLTVPAYLTLPNVAVKKNLPTIVFVGRYPWARDADWAFDPAAQFLASRGYAVIQPEARGVRGFGKAYFEAGLKQWGLRMQDDLADGAKWAIAQGIADPKRICIIGSVYGGYAALMGMVKDPQLFRCAVSWAGIGDIGSMFKSKWPEFPPEVEGRTMNELVGDPDTDQAQFAATSPIANGARIKGPVFLAYGAEDVQVPGTHGKRIFDAIRPANAQVEFHLYDQKGQDWSLVGNRVDMWTKIEKFLERSVGKP